MPAQPGQTPAARGAAAVTSALDAHADPVRAEGTKAYLKSDRTHLGVRLPDLRASVRTVLRHDPALAAHDDVIALARGLWAGPTFEHQLAAVEVLSARTSVLGTDDLAVVERMLRDCRTWALVDPLADTVVGDLVAREPADAYLLSTLDRWAVDPDFWLRRSALLSQLRRLRPAGRTDADLADFVRWADPMLEEREFFVRKAIGWVLRDVSRRNPGPVVAYLQPRVARLSGVSWREAVRRLPDADRDALETLRSLAQRRGTG